MKQTFSELVEIFGKQALAELFRDKIFEFGESTATRFTPAQRQYLTYRLGDKDGKFAIRLGEVVKKSRRKQSLAYWSRLYLRVTDRPKLSANNLTDSQIEMAREYPTHELYDGRLIRSGRNFKCLCPFHLERTPSFMFYADGSYHCFGACGAHGNNAVDYVMATEKLKFPDAVRRLL